ncbi:unnamed protein product [Boreogadus saida]
MDMSGPRTSSPATRDDSTVDSEPLAEACDEGPEPVSMKEAEDQGPGSFSSSAIMDSPPSNPSRGSPHDAHYDGPPPAPGPARRPPPRRACTGPRRSGPHVPPTPRDDGPPRPAPSPLPAAATGGQRWPPAAGKTAMPLETVALSVAPPQRVWVWTPLAPPTDSHSAELKILSVYGKGEGPLAVDGHDTLFTASEVEALNSLSADHSAAKSLERAEQLVCHGELSVQHKRVDQRA